MKKKIIGLIGPRCENKNNPFLTYTKFIDNYAQKIKEAGALAIGIIFPKNIFSEDALSICDGIVIQGGSYIDEVYLSVIHYAFKEKIPLLGICVGMQAMVGYDYLCSNYLIGSYKDIELNYKGDDDFLEKCLSHNNVNPFNIKEIDKAKHIIMLENSSLNKPFLIEPSLHNYKIKDFPLKYFKVTGKTLDGVTEMIERDNPYMLGCQFHPELEDDFLFQNFVKKVLNKT